jgi:hypothetical protein
MTQELIRVIDRFCPEIDLVRQSALDSGFGKWTPNKGLIGSSIYEGMNYTGKHSYFLKALALTLGYPVFPNSMFFRVTNKDTEGAYTHSDRNMGTKTCLVYMSEHEAVSGTGFFKHRATGLIEMPPLEAMVKDEALFALLAKDMVSGGEKEWEQLDFVRGLYNRAVIFHAPLFHARCPKNGLGDNSENGRMIWAAHFNTLLPGGGFQ